ncbi:hypothetical protein KKA15_00050 [Patescibacteria group bacterium]|nr:hypothetical protein [Patescibacteria group bacterium]
MLLKDVEQMLPVDIHEILTGTQVGETLTVIREGPVLITAEIESISYGYAQIKFGERILHYRGNKDWVLLSVDGKSKNKIVAVKVEKPEET